MSGTSNLDSYSFAELVKFISKAGKKGLLQPSNLLMLLARILVMSPHSMHVEFAISVYNLIKDDHRASLDRETMNAYLVVHLDMPPVSHFDPRPIAARWFKQPTEQDSQQRKKPRETWDMEKYKSQEYFRGFFKEADVKKEHRLKFPKKKQQLNSFLKLLCIKCY